MTKAKLTAGSLVSAAYDFARRGWARAFAILFLAASAQAAIFVGQHADIQHALALKIEAAGWLGALLTATPAMGALYRVRQGGASLKDLGPGGLQWTKVEWGLIGVATLLFLSAVLFCIPAMAFATIATLALYYGAGIGLQTSMQVGSFAFIGVMLIWLFTVLRVFLAAPATVASRQVRVFQTWPLSRGKAATLGLGFLGALLPAIGLLAGAQAVLNGLETGDFVPWATAHWPLADAAAAGGALGLASAVLIPGLIAGLFGEAYAVLGGEAVTSAAKTEAPRSAEIIPLPIPANEAPAAETVPAEGEIAALADEGLLEHAMLLAPYVHAHEDEPPAKEIELPSGLAHSATPPLDDTGGYVWRMPEAEAHSTPAKGPEWEALIAALAPGLVPPSEVETASAESTHAHTPANDSVPPIDAPAVDLVSEPVPEPVHEFAPELVAEPPPIMAPAEIPAAEPFIEHLIPAAAQHMTPAPLDAPAEMQPEHLAQPSTAIAPEASSASEPPLEPAVEAAVEVAPEPATAVPPAELAPAEALAPWPPLRIAAAADPVQGAEAARPSRPPKLTLVRPLFSVDVPTAPSPVFEPSPPHSGRSAERSSGEPASECVDP